jgi:hypothetical protein
MNSGNQSSCRKPDAKWSYTSVFKKREELSYSTRHRKCKLYRHNQSSRSQCDIKLTYTSVQRNRE